MKREIISLVVVLTGCALVSLWSHGGVLDDFTAGYLFGSLVGGVLCIVGCFR